MKPEIAPPQATDQGLIDFPELVRTFGRYKWGIAGLTLLSMVVAALVAFTIRPMYTGTTSVLVETQSPRVATLGDVYASELPEKEFIGAQMAILKSLQVARSVVDRLELVDSPEFEEVLKTKANTLDLRRYLPFLPVADALDEPVTDEERRERVVADLVDRLLIEPYGATGILYVRFEAYSPAMAAQIANGVADAYIESGLQARLDATTKATSWLTGKLAEIEDSLRNAENELQQFRETEQLVNVGGARSLSEDEVLDLSRRLREAQLKRTQLQSAYERIRAAGNSPRQLRDISALLTDPVAQSANENFLEAQEVVKQYEDRYGPRHPQMSTARARLATAEAALNEQLQIAAHGVRAEYEIALASERAARQQLDVARGQIQQLDRKDYELSVLQRNVETYRELYDTFLSRFKETDVAGSFQAVSARVIDPAIEPNEPSWPRKKRIVLLAGIAGLVASILLALLHYLLSEGISSAEELESVSQLPVLGVLPLVTGFIGRNTNLVKYYMEKSQTPFSEGLRSTCASLRLADRERSLKRIVVASSVPAEGKSSVSATLALALASSEKVVLLETDLRKPSLRRLFNFETNARGLTHVLSGEATLEDCLHWHEAGGIWVLPIGRVPGNSTELLGSPGFAEVLNELSRRFDRVILDSPPVQAAADALVLGRHSDGILFVVKSEATSRRSVRNSLKQLRFASIPVVGAIVNQVDTRRNPHYADSYNYVYKYYG